MKLWALSKVLYILIIFILLVIALVFSKDLFIYHLNNIGNNGDKSQYYEEITHELSENQINYEDISVEQQTDFDELVSNLRKYKGQYSLYIKNLEDHAEEYRYQENKKYYAASLYKVPVAVSILKEIDRGNISLDTKVEYKKEDTADGTGVIYHSPTGTKYSVESILSFLLKQSDNTGQNILMRSFSKTTSEQAFSLVNRLSDFHAKNITSAKEYSDFLMTIYEGDYLTEESKGYLFDLMSNTSFDDWIADKFNKDMIFAHKIGSWPGSFHDCGILFYPDKKYVLCMMSENSTLEEFKLVSEDVAEFMNIL